MLNFIVNLLVNLFLAVSILSIFLFFTTLAVMVISERMAIIMRLKNQGKTREIRKKIFRRLRAIRKIARQKRMESEKHASRLRQTKSGHR